MAKNENGVVTGTETGVVVEVEAGQNILLDVASADLVVFSQDGSDLVVTSIADGTSVILENFFSQAGTDLPPQLTLSDGSVISATEVTGLVEEFNPDLVAPAAGPAAGAAQGGGGAGFSAFDDDGIGDGIGISGLLDPTELGFPADTPDDDLTLLTLIPDQPELDLNEIGLGALNFSRPREEDDNQSRRVNSDEESGDAALTQALLGLENPEIDSFIDFAGRSDVDFIELRNTTNSVQSTAGNGESTVGEGTTSISIIGPDGDPVTIDLPTLDIPAGGKLVLMQAEGEEGVQTIYVVFDSEGAPVGGGSLADNQDWPMGDDTSDPLGVLLSWAIDGSVTELDTFLANGAQFEPASLNAGWLGNPDPSAELDIFGDSGTFNGQIATQEVVAPGIFDAYAPISLEQLVECSPIAKTFFLDIDVNNVFARVDNADTNTAADWTTGQTPTVGDNNDAYDPNPQDPYNDDMNPGQGEGPDSLVGEDIDNDGQNVIVAGVNDEDFINEETGAIEGGRGQDFLKGDEGTNTLDGGAHNDYLDGGAGNDLLDGGSGGDVLIDDQGQDMMVGGTGTDILFGRRDSEEGEDLKALIGKGDPDESGDEIGNEAGAYQPGTGDLLIGDEVISGGWGNDQMYGGGGNDFFAQRALFDGGFGNGDFGDPQQYMRDIIVAGDGNDIIYGDNAGLGPDFGPEDIDALYSTIINSLNNFGPYNFAYMYRGAVEWNYGGADLIYGGWGNDLIFGQGGDDAILAGHGDDVAAGGSGDDKIRGNGGDDSLYGDTGDDTMYGDAGDDYMEGNEGADLMYGGDGRDEMKGGGGADVMYGDAGNDDMQGNSGDDVMYGGSGNDNMHGGSGNDVMYGDAGDDHMGGGSGNDVMYGGSGRDDMHGDSGDDIMYGGEGRDNMRGDSGDDVMYGDAGNDRMRGGSGEDTMYGGEGRDNMRGDSGDDLMYGEAGNDRMRGDSGEDTMYGGEGRDNMRGDSGADLMYGEAGNDRMRGGSGNDTMYGGEGRDNMHGDSGDDEMSGGAGNDHMGGGSGNDEMSGGAGNDYMHGDSGNDLMYGDAGDDTLLGGSGNDTVWGGSNNAYNEGPGSSGDDYVELGSGDDRFDDNFINSGTDTVHGGEGNDIMWTGDGDDLLYGDEGNDRMFGEHGDDLMYGGEGRDTMRGGSGEDTMYGDDGQDNMHGDSGDDVMYGGAGNDHMGGGSGNDLMYGGSGNDDMHGDAGDDTLIGGTGNDDMYGGDGNDLLVGGTGNDDMYGGDGNDLLVGGTGNDDMYGDAGDDMLIGGSGNDDMYGGSGNDLLVGGTGNDDMYGDAGDDTLIGGTGNDDMYGDAGDDMLIGGSGNDDMYGGSGNDLLVGGTGNDDMYGDAGDDTLIGGSGNDDMYGGSGNDLLVGGTGNDDMYGGDGADTLRGGTGNDDMFGGDGNDLLVGDAGDDDMSGGDGNDVMRGGSGDDSMGGDAGDDHMHGGSGNDTMSGGEGDDTMLGGSGSADVMYGDAGDDVMYGDNGDNAAIGDDDTMFGGAGNDEMHGEGGADVMYGDGAGSGSSDGAVAVDKQAGNNNPENAQNLDGSFGVQEDANVAQSDSIPHVSVTATGDGSADWYSFTVTEDGSLVMLDIDGGRTYVNPTGGMDTELFLFNAAGDLVAFNDDNGRDAGSEETGLDSRIQVNLAAGIYYLAVAEWPSSASDGFSVTGNVPDNGDTYSLHVSVENHDISEAGNDSMTGGAGDDVMYGDSGNDGENGGDDTMEGGAGNDQMLGEGGDDLLRGDAGDDEMSGGAGNDELRGGEGRDDVSGDSGDDLMYGGAGNDTMSGGDGNDTMMGDGGDDSMDGGTGNDQMHGGDGNDTMLGGDGDDLMYGDDGADVMYGGDGNDTVWGGSDNAHAGDGQGDYADLGAGNDVFDDNGVSGVDTVLGGAGNDTMWSGDQGDLLYGGSGNDRMSGEAGDDVMSGDEGDDFLRGQGDDDTMSGGQGNDTLRGDSGDDTLKWDTSEETAGSSDNYMGGSGNGDILEIYLTQDEFDTYEGAIAEFANRVENGETATLNIGGKQLTAGQFENVAVHVDNVEIPVLIDDTINVDENSDSLGNTITATLATPGQDFVPNDGDVEFNAPEAVSVTMPGAAFPVVFDASDWSETAPDSGIWELNMLDGATDYGVLTFDASNPENVQVSLDVPEGQDTVYDPLDDGDQASIVFDYSAQVEGSESATVTINVNGVNDGPVAGDDIVITNTLDGIYVPQYAMLANDSDIEDDPLHVASVTPPASIDGDDVYVPGGNRVINGSFEDQGDGSNINKSHGSSWATYDNLPGWMIDSDEADAPIELQFGGTGGIKAQDGNAKMELDSHAEGGYTQSNSHVFQDVPTEAGEKLTVSFWYSPRTSGSTNDVEVWWDGELLTTLSGNSKGWQEYAFEVDASETEETSRLEFRGLPTEDTFGGYIDNVYVGDRDYDYNVSDGDLEDTGHVDVQYQTGNGLLGGDQAEIIIGGDEADTIAGGDGDDTIIGGGGDDRIYGQDGGDTFHYSDADEDGDDAIFDFDASEDVINLDALFDELGIAPADRADMVNLELSGDDTVITVEGQSDFSITVADSDLTGDGSLTPEQLLAQNGIVVSDES
ncbi:MAG: Ig-like domain-containing protein [Sneathiella sp.]